MPSKSPSSPSTTAAPRKRAAKPAAPATPPAPRIEMRQSGVHGNGVFAREDIAEGETLIEYLGEVIDWKEALRRHPHDPAQPNHTFYFHIDDERVIDGGVNGNDARWINHSCEPNCIADEREGRIFIQALRNIAAGEELSYDYGLIIDEPYTPQLLADFPCWCGSESCRGTLLSPKDDEDELPGKKAKSKKGKKDKDGKKAKAEGKSKDKKKDAKADKKVEKKTGKKAEQKAEKKSDKKTEKKGGKKKEKPGASAPAAAGDRA